MHRNVRLSENHNACNTDAFPEMMYMAPQDGRTGSLGSFNHFLT